MIDYRRMCFLLSGAITESLDILWQGADSDAINSVRNLLQQAMMDARHVYIATAKQNDEME